MNIQFCPSQLFERSPSSEYIEEWTKSLRETLPQEQSDQTLSILIFRLGQDWLALPTIYFKEVARRREVHRIPHRSGKILQGIVSLNGELRLFVALNQLLEIESFASSQIGKIPYQQDRMVAIIKDSDLWVFAVDEIEGIINWNLSNIENVPVNVAKSTANFMKGIIKINDKSVGLLDEELLFSSLKRSVE